jgi:GTP-binding protein HflX
MGKAKRELHDTNVDESRTLALCVFTPDLRHNHEYFHEEFLSLVKTAGIDPIHSTSMKLRSIDPPTFFTKGKLEELIDLCKEQKATDVVISTHLSPLQERNLQEMLGIRIFDRSQLILEIFHQAAHSAEGKIQVEMAYLELLKTRLAGRGKEMAQQEGFVGSRGPGETEKEVLRRYYAGKLKQSRKRLEQLAQARATQRKKRLSSNVPLVSLVGYTNAGKSSLLNLLTNGKVLAEDKLFATLDTTTKELYLGPEKKALLSDTVGFISNLPHQLIEAFRSTLDELRYAGLLLHVVDISNPAWHEHVMVVKETLSELGIKTPMLYVMNKSDKLDDEAREALASQLETYDPHVIVHTTEKDGAQNLVEYLKKWVQKRKKV